MVWGFFPTDSSRGIQKYYIFSKGTYKVGRKDCDVIVQTDTSISRLHAEIVIDRIISYDPTCPVSTYVSIFDRSKYGTWINKDLGANAARVSKDKGAVLQDGDIVTFGTGIASFRFTFVPIDIFIHCLRPNYLDPAIQATAESIGARAVCKWSISCTHVLVDQASHVTVDLIEAVAAKRPIVTSDWLKVLKEKKIQVEFPHLSSFLPTLSLEGTSVNIAEPKTRERCLEGYTFIMGPSQNYKFGDKFHTLQEAFGATVLSPNDFCSGSQISTEGGGYPVLVVPDKVPNLFDRHSHLSTLSKVAETKLLVAILSGRMESAIIEPPSILVTSSHSTDETIVADSDVEIDTATYDRPVDIVKPQDALNDEYEFKGTKFGTAEDAKIRETKEDGGGYSTVHLGKSITAIPKDENMHCMKKIEKNDVSAADEYQNSDIIYSQDLVVRTITEPDFSRPNTKKVVNFKRFRKTDTVSGNSFKDLVPFSKEPYNESGYGSIESGEYVKEEKRRKQIEAIAEDLFKNEKARKRAPPGTSLQAFLSRR